MTVTFHYCSWCAESFTDRNHLADHRCSYLVLRSNLDESVARAERAEARVTQLEEAIQSHRNCCDDYSCAKAHGCAPDERLWAVLDQ